MRRRTCPAAPCRRGSPFTYSISPSEAQSSIALVAATRDIAPSGIMFADGIRLSGLELLARHRIKEGLPLCVSLIDPGRWGLQNRIRRCLASLRLYGGAARSAIPHLRRLEEEQDAFEAFLQRLREAKDKAEFDQFMDERARAAAAPRDDEADTRA